MSSARRSGWECSPLHMAVTDGVWNTKPAMSSMMQDTRSARPSIGRPDGRRVPSRSTSKDRRRSKLRTDNARMMAAVEGK